MLKKYTLTLVITGSIGVAPSAWSAQLLGYYNFNDNADPSVSADVVDCSPEVRLNNGAVYTDDAGGFSGNAGDRGLDLGEGGDGAHAVSRVGGHLSLATIANEISVSWWQNNAGNGAGGFNPTSSFWLTAPASSDGQRGLQVHGPWSNGVVFMDQAGCCATPGQRLTVASGKVTAGVWQHFVVQRNAAGAMEIWIDGVLEASATGANALDLFNGEITIGARQGGLSSFSGVIDDFAIFAGTMSQTEIEGLAAQTLDPVAISTPLEDLDSDGLADVWETFHGLSTTDDGTTDIVNGPMGDQDADGVLNLDEFKAGLSPVDDDFDNDTLLDGVETNTGVWNSITDTGTNPFSSDTDGDTLSDDVENPDLPYVDASQTGSNPNLVDTDSDGLTDSLEVSVNLDPSKPDTDDNGTDDGDEDLDMDTLTNLEEVALGTMLDNADTDGDDLDDNVETNDGNWVSVNETGTNPLSADSDGDTIRDGVENPDLAYDPNNPATQPGTDPNKIDSDGDQVSDSIEINAGTDPTDVNDFPAVDIVTIIPGLLGGDLTDPEDDGQRGSVIAGPPQTAGTNFNWTSIEASEEQYFSGFGGSQGAFDVFDNRVGAGDKWCCGGASVASPLTLTVGFAEPISLTHFTITSSADVAARDPRDWQILGSNDNVDFEPVFTQLGDTPLWTARNQTLRIDLGNPSPPYLFFRYQVTRTGNANHQITELEYFGVPGEPAPVRISSISYDQAADTVTLEWTSEPAAEYTIYYDSDLGAFDADAGDGFVGSAGETTSVTIPNPLPGQSKLFFRVGRN